MPNGLMAYQRTMTGAELNETVRAFVEGCEGGFVPFNRGSLPVVSGIAVEVKEANGSYTLTGITRNGQPLGDNDTVTVTCLATEKQREYGFRVDPAENGAVAVEKLRTAAPGSYDLVLMDVQMPVMDGYTATRQIRALGDPALAKIPILAMTANAFDEDRRNAMESGMTGFLSKPIVIGDLVQELRKIL